MSLIRATRPGVCDGQVPGRFPRVGHRRVAGGAGYDTSDLGRGNNAMTPADVGRMTGDSSSNASHAAHDQRDDNAGNDGIPVNRHSD